MVIFSEDDGTDNWKPKQDESEDGGGTSETKGCLGGQEKETWVSQPAKKEWCV